MFYCDACAVQRGWPTHSFLPRSLGACELCNKVTSCNDVPSVWLRKAKPATENHMKPTPETIENAERQRIADLAAFAEQNRVDNEERDRLRAALRSVTDLLDELLTAGEFPGKGRSADDKDAMLGWWDARTAAVVAAQKLLEQ